METEKIIMARKKGKNMVMKGERTKEEVGMERGGMEEEIVM